MGVLMSDENGNLTQYAGSKLPAGYLALLDEINNIKNIQDNKVEKVEVIYDRESNDINLNWGYDDGIGYNVRVEHDFSKYKKLIVYFATQENIPSLCLGPVIISLVEKNIQNRYDNATTGFYYAYNGYSYGWICEAYVNSTKSAITNLSLRVQFRTYGDDGAYASIIKIEGVY